MNSRKIFRAAAPVLAALLSWALAASPAPAQSDYIPAEAEGYSASAASSPSARDEAIRASQRAAVEQAAGTYISSETDVQNAVVIKDRILAKAGGFARGRTILDEGPRDGLYWVRVRWEVASGPLRDEVLAIQAALGDRGLPRVIVIGSETIDGNPSYDRAAGTQIEKVLANKGFELVDASAFEALKQRDASLADVNQDYGRAVEVAHRFKADYTITYNAVANYDGPIGYDFAPHVFTATVTARVVDPTTASLTGAESETLAGSAQSIPRAAAKAFENAGAKMAPPVVDELLKILERPAYVEVEVGNASFRFARELKERLGTIREVEMDGRVNFSSGVATARLKTKLNAFDVASVLDEEMSDVLAVDDVVGNKVKANYIGDERRR